MSNSHSLSSSSLSSISNAMALCLVGLPHQTSLVADNVFVLQLCSSISFIAGWESKAFLRASGLSKGSNCRCIWIFFKAYIYSSSLCLTLYTAPKAPSPRSLTWSNVFSCRPVSMKGQTSCGFYTISYFGASLA